MMKISTLVEQIKEAFEVQVKTEGKTLAEAISNELAQEGVPRISPELFQRTRDVEIKLTQKQEEKIKEFYLSNQRGRKEGRELVVKCFGKIPQFSYSLNPESGSSYKIVRYNNVADIFVKEKFEINGKRESGLESSILFCVDGDGDRWFKEHKDFGFPFIYGSELSLKVDVLWRAPFKLCVNAEIPSVPENILKEEVESAYELYYKLASDLARKNRSFREMSSPSLGILWSPIESDLYCTGEIPAPQIIHTSRRDPILVLEIQENGGKYMHAVAAWNIGEELPFKNWLREYSEGSIDRSLK